MKRCGHCKIEKEESGFNKDASRTSGFHPVCRECVNEASKRYYIRYREKKKIAWQIYSEKNKEKILAKATKYNREHVKEHKEYYQKNKLAIAAKKKYTPEKGQIAYRRHKERMKQDIEYKLMRNLRGRLHAHLRGRTKAGSVQKDLGCTVKELKLYLESKFQPGMTWGNYGRLGWHIDHIRPLCTFDLKDPRQFQLANCYQNLQPLWWWENFSKSKKFEVPPKFKFNLLAN